MARPKTPYEIRYCKNCAEKGLKTPIPKKHNVGITKYKKKNHCCLPCFFEYNAKHNPVFQKRTNAPISS